MMSLSRYNTSRNKSRSPAPHSGFRSPSSRPFLPPSHYAAAAGLPYPSGHMSSTDYGDSRETILPSTTSSSVSPYPGSLKAMSYASQSSHLETSSFESNAALNNQQSNLKRRQSRLGDLPMLEAQLLPSLRDTIDRMTQPSQASVDSSSRSPYLEPPDRSGHPASTSSLSSPSASGSSLRRPATPQSTLSSTSYTNPKPDWAPRSVPSTPSVQSNSQPKLKSALKSALRPLTPKLSVNHGTIPNTPSQSAGGSLRTTKTSVGTGKKTQVLPAPSTMVADIKRGAGIASYGRSTSPNVRPEQPVMIRNARARSRTDPGAAAKTPPALPQSAATPQPHSLYVASRLPRPNERPKPKRPEHESEVTECFDVDSKGNWKLVAANAIVAPSSSSESERNPPIPEKTSRLPKSKDRYALLAAPDQTRGETLSRFGLGFGFGDYGAKLRGIFTDSTNRIVADDDDAPSVYGEDPCASIEHGLSHAADSSMGSASDWQSQELIQDQRGRGLSRRRSYDEEPPDVYRKRREALLGIVQGLDQEPGPKSRLSRNSSVFDDSNYSGHKGLAISGSGYFDTVGHVDTGHANNANQRGSQYQPEELDQVPRRRHSSEKRRTDTVSRSPLPTFKISTEDDDHRQGTGTGRSNASLSPTPDRERLSRSTASSPQNGYQNYREDLGQRSAWNGGAVVGRKLQSKSSVVRNGGTGTPVARSAFQTSQQVTSPIPSGERHDRYRAECGKRSNTPQQATLVQNLGPSAMSSVAASSRAAATRQREAFGIPRPISDYYADSGHEVVSQELPHVDSNLSSVCDDSWRENCEGFSAEAETLFEKLGGRNYREEDTRGRRSSTKSHQGQLRCNDRDFPRQRSHSPLSQNSDRSSVYDEHGPESTKVEKGRGAAPLKDNESWRSSIPPSAYRSLLERHGEVEMQRQEVIWELCETEDVFVNHLHSIVRLFVQPLRAQNSKTWITGVPADVARLFDWLEDIVNLHSQISAALHAARESHYSTVERVAESLKAFVPRLEIYQPYLVRLEDIAALIERLMEDEQSDFGEFVTLQESSTECDGWSLEKFLIEPVNRLAQYPEFFRRLLGVTPSSHPDYLPTFSLLHSTNMIIRVLSEVKFREDEYDVVKDIATRIHGLPSSAQLARRERRLIAQGPLHRLQSAHHLLNFASTSDATQNRTPRLITAIDDWGAQRDRSGSVKSTSTTTMSFRSYDTTSSCSSENRFDSHRGIVSPPHGGRDTSYAGFRTPPSSQDRLRPSQQTIVNAFVFTDLVVFATPITRRESNKCQNWRLLEDIGIARILAVTEGPEISSDTKDSLVLDLLPMSVTELETGVLESNPAVVPLYLSVPGDAASDTSSTSSRRTQTNWLSMFRQCSQFTLRSLSFLSHSGGRLDHGPEVDLELDTHQSVLAIMASGLPLPKSPSVQLEEVVLGESGSARQQEREERGWWSLRFQQVLREMQRRDALPVLTERLVTEVP